MVPLIALGELLSIMSLDNQYHRYKLIVSAVTALTVR